MKKWALRSIQAKKSRGTLERIIYMGIREGNMQKDLIRMGSVISKCLKGLKPINIKEIVPDEEEARYVYIFSADMIKGFCKEGNLASERVDAISQPIAKTVFEL